MINRLLFTTLVGVAIFSGALRSLAEGYSEPTRAWRTEHSETSEHVSRFRASVRDKATAAARAAVTSPDRYEVESARNGSTSSWEGTAPELILLSVDGPNLSGITRVRFRMSRGRQDLGTASVTLRGAVRGPALVTTRTARAGEPIPEGAVEIADADLTRLREAPLRSKQELENLAPVRTLGRGRVLTPSLVKAAPVIHRGETVNMIIQRGRLTVNALGIARTDGAPGETIAARNTWTGAEILGKVQVDGTLLVVRGAIRKGAKR